MARPQKDGLEYFPLNTDIDQDDKLQLIEAQFGITGFGIVIKLLMKIYREGYYYEWSEKEQLLFSRKVNVDINEANDIVNECLKWDLFDMDLYKQYGILTSRGIQRRYFEAVNRRKEVEVISEYCLIDLKKQTNIVYVNINLVNVNINQNNTDISTQSKVKESKGKETTTTATETSADDFDPQELESSSSYLFKKYEKGLGRTLNVIEIDKIMFWLESHDPALIEHALEIAVLGGNRSFKYIGGILNNWRDKGVKCIQDAQDLERKFVEKKKNNSSLSKPRAPSETPSAASVINGGNYVIYNPDD